MSFFFDGYIFVCWFRNLKKKHDAFFFGCPGQRPGPPLLALTGLPTSYQAAATAAGGAGAGAAITGAMEAEKTEKPRKKSKWDQASASGGGGTPGRVKFFLPRRFFFHKKGGWIFFLKRMCCLFWFEVGLYGPTQRARERAWNDFTLLLWSILIRYVLYWGHDIT